MKLAPLRCAFVVALAAYSATAQPASGKTYTCLIYISWKSASGSWFTPLGTGPVSGSTVTVAASKCHANARSLFQTNAAWYPAATGPKEICKSWGKPDKWGRIFTGALRTVWLLDRFLEFSSNPQTYNRIDSYVADCRRTGFGFINWDHVLKPGVLML